MELSISHIGKHRTIRNDFLENITIHLKGVIIRLTTLSKVNVNNITNQVTSKKIDTLQKMQ
jgi:hypothetical protein